MSRSRKQKGCNRGCPCRAGITDLIAVRVARRAPIVGDARPESLEHLPPCDCDEPSCAECTGLADALPASFPLRAPLIAEAIRKAAP